MLLIISKATIVVAFVLSQNPFATVFMIPAYLVGIAGVWLKGSNTLSKIRWTIIPLILWYPWYLLTLFVTNTFQQKFDFYFPKNFNGPVLVVSRITCGQLEFKKNGRDQLHIPESGVLLYQGRVKPGRVDHKYYYKYENDSLVAIPNRDSLGQFFAKDNLRPSLQVVRLGSMGTSETCVPVPCIEYSWIAFSVGSSDSIDQKNIPIDSLFNIANGQIRNCLKK